MQKRILLCFLMLAAYIHAEQIAQLFDQYKKIKGRNPPTELTLLTKIKANLKSTPKNIIPKIQKEFGKNASKEIQSRIEKIQKTLRAKQPAKPAPPAKIPALTVGEAQTFASISPQVLQNLAISPAAKKIIVKIHQLLNDLFSKAIKGIPPNEQQYIRNVLTQIKPVVARPSPALPPARVPVVPPTPVKTVVPPPPPSPAKPEVTAAPVIPPPPLPPAKAKVPVAPPPPPPPSARAGVPVAPPPPPPPSVAKTGLSLTEELKARAGQLKKPAETSKKEAGEKEGLPFLEEIQKGRKLRHVEPGKKKEAGEKEGLPFLEEIREEHKLRHVEPGKKEEVEPKSDIQKELEKVLARRRAAIKPDEEEEEEQINPEAPSFDE